MRRLVDSHEGLIDLFINLGQSTTRMTYFRDVIADAACWINPAIRDLGGDFDETGTYVEAIQPH